MQEETTRRFLWDGQRNIGWTEFPAYSIDKKSMNRFLSKIPATEYVGIAGAYSDGDRKLTHLAFSTFKMVVCISLNPREGESSKKRNPDETTKILTQVLNETFGENSKYKFLAFDAERIAIGLFYDWGVRVNGMLHLQALTTGKKLAQSSRRTIYDLFEPAGYQDTDRADLVDAFDDDNSTPDWKHRIKFRASSAYYMQKLHPERIHDALEEDMFIRTADVSDANLGAIATAARTTDRLDRLKPNWTKNEHRSAKVNPETGTVEIELDRYKSRTHANQGDQHIVIEVTTDSGKVEQVVGSIVSQKGRTAIFKPSKPASVRKLKDAKGIKDIHTFGKEDPTQQEVRFQNMVTGVLRGVNTKIVESSVILQVLLRHIGPGASSRGPLEDHNPLSHTALDSLPEAVTVRLNDSQKRAVQSFCSGEATPKKPIIRMVQGPPGSGKTTMIAAMVQWFNFRHFAEGSKNKRGIYLICQSNVGVKNIAEKLMSVGFTSWRIIVSTEFKFEWHEHLYEKIKDYVIESVNLPKSMIETKKLLGGAQIILCTLSMFTSKGMDTCGLTRTLAVPEILIVDEASQVLVNDYLPGLTGYAATLKRVCFVGDDKQLPPHGAAQLGDIESVFEIRHIRQNAMFLNTQYRMPIPIGDFLSSEFYGNKLLSHHRITSPYCVRFIDVVNGGEMTGPEAGGSSLNLEEIEAVVRCVHQLSSEGKDLRVITPYDAQRNEIEKKLKEEGLRWEETVFNVDSFQGNECDFIIVSVVRTEAVGFLSDPRRMNVMLSRARKGMIIVAKRAFVQSHPEILVAKLAERLGTGWLLSRELENGEKIFSDEDLLGQEPENDSEGDCEPQMEATDLEAITPPVSDLDTIIEVPSSETLIATDVPIAGASNKDATISVEQQRPVEHIEDIPYDISPRRIRFLNASNPTCADELPGFPELLRICQIFEQTWPSFFIVVSSQDTKNSLEGPLQSARQGNNDIHVVSGSLEPTEYSIVFLPSKADLELITDEKVLEPMLRSGRKGTVVITSKDLLNGSLAPDSLVQITKLHENEWLVLTSATLIQELFLPDLPSDPATLTVPEEASMPLANSSLSWDQDIAPAEDPPTSNSRQRRTKPAKKNKKPNGPISLGRVAESSTSSDPVPGPPSFPLQKPSSRARVVPSPSLTVPAAPSRHPAVPRRPASKYAIAQHLMNPEPSALGASPAAAPYARELPASIQVSLDDDQRVAVARLCSGEATASVPIVCMVTGPAGSGKSRVIAAMVQWLCSETVSSHLSTCYILTRHEFGVPRLARNLQTNGFSEFKAILSGKIDSVNSKLLEGKLLEYSSLEESLPKLRSMFGAVCAIICTLEVFTKLEQSILTKRLIPPEVVICEDSNQIPIAALHQTLEAYGDSIARLCFIGDDTQRLPRGEYNTPLHTAFDIQHIRKNAITLSTQHRLPPPVSEFFSHVLYGGTVVRATDARQSLPCPIRFIDVSTGMQTGKEYSFLNEAEIDAALQCAALFTKESLPFKIVTPFEAQRKAIEEGLQASELAWQDICHTVETIQGADAPYIVFTVAQTYSPGFLNDFGSTVTAITRFSEGMIVISNERFLTEDSVAMKSVLADMANVFTDSDGWIDVTALSEPTISTKRLFEGDNACDQTAAPHFDDLAGGPTVSWGDTPIEDPTGTGVGDFGWDETPGATWG